MGQPNLTNNYVMYNSNGATTAANSAPMVLATDAVVSVTQKVASTTLFSGTRTASATGATFTGFAGANNIIFQLAVTAVSGTVPNMVVMVEDSLDGINWYTIATFTAVTAVTNQILRVAGPFCNSLRSRSVTTGTTPSLTFSVVAQSEGGQ